jgi:hypothetical protein
MLKLDPTNEKRMNELVDKTHVSFTHRVFGIIKECNHPIYKVEWMMRDSPNTLVTMGMDRNEIEPLPGYLTETATYGPLDLNQTPNRLTPGEIQAAAALTRGNDGGKKARRSRKSRKSRKVRKSYKKYRKSRKVRKSRRARR